MNFQGKSIGLSEERRKTFKKCNNYTKELSKSCNTKTANILLLQPFLLIYWIQRPSFLQSILLYLKTSNIVTIYNSVSKRALVYIKEYVFSCSMAKSNDLKLKQEVARAYYSTEKFGLSGHLVKCIQFIAAIYHNAVHKYRNTYLYNLRSIYT